MGRRVAVALAFAAAAIAPAGAQHGDARADLEQACLTAWDFALVVRALAAAGVPRAQADVARDLIYSYGDAVAADLMRRLANRAYLSRQPPRAFAAEIHRACLALRLPALLLEDPA